MSTFEWNALRVDDRVLVHDRARGTDAVLSGTVVMIETHHRVNRHRGVNTLGIRTSDSSIVWPNASSVDRVPRERAAIS
jgi:hypothetical protein